MRILFYGTKTYDKIWFEPMAKKYGYEIHFLEAAASLDTIKLSAGYDAVCIFVNDYLDKDMIDILVENGVKGILLRSAGFNHVDIEAAKGRIRVLRVPSYSPEAVAEYALAMLLTVNRYTHKAYTRTRDFNMSIHGLMGMDLHQKTIGIIGTGKIGQSMIRLMSGFQMEILAYDPYPVSELPVQYVELDELFRRSDVISLHCPLTQETRHIINGESIAKMKDGVYLVNTSRGGLIHSESLIQGLLSGKFKGVGLDVYEEEDGVFYEDCSTQIMQDEVLARLVTFPNVLITSHMGFFTEEAMKAIASETLKNAQAVEKNQKSENAVV